MSAAPALLAVAALAMVAAAGVLAGFRRPDVIPVESPADPLEDRRVALLRSLADLEDAHASGVLDDEGYDRLRRDTDARMARLLHAIEDRRARAVVATVAEERATARGPLRIPRVAVATLLAGTVGAVLVAGLLRDAEPAAPPAAPIAEDPLAFFERRVAEHPDDLAARLDLAHRYLDAARIQDALTQYAAALELDPDDAEAHAHVGLVLLLADRPREALTSVDRALQTAPDYPEALFIRGWILLDGLDRPADAIASLERYLELAPFGAERDRAQELIDSAREELG